MKTLAILLFTLLTSASFAADNIPILVNRTTRVLTSPTNAWTANAAGISSALSLGNAATKNVGTGAGTVAAGDDSRFGVGVTDGDKGSLTVSGTGTVWTVDGKAITLGMMADGTAGRLITYDASGVITTVLTGTLGQALLSNGPGTEPTFQTLPGGGDALTANGLSQFAGGTTSAQLQALLTNESGTGAALFAGGALGAATATSINGLTLTTTTGTLTVANGATLTATSTASVAGTHSGTSSGSNTGDQTSVTGNAGTATALATARTINGTSFNGTANITVTSAAGTLTGATLASGVLASSLTSVGTLAGLTVTAPIAGSVTGQAGYLFSTNFTVAAVTNVDVNALNLQGQMGAPATVGSAVLTVDVYEIDDPKPDYDTGANYPDFMVAFVRTASANPGGGTFLSIGNGPEWEIVTSTLVALPAAHIPAGTTFFVIANAVTSQWILQTPYP